MRIGFNARLFPNNWHPILNEVASARFARFARKHGFRALQFGGTVDGLSETDLGASFLFEIDGLPKSGGYGCDTDMALADSLQRFRQANLLWSRSLNND